MQGADEGSVDFQDPAFGGQLHDFHYGFYCAFEVSWFGEPFRGYVLLQVPDAHAAGDAGDVDGEGHVLAPCRGDVVGDDTRENAVHRVAEDAGDDGGGGEGDAEGDGEQREEHVDLLHL